MGRGAILVAVVLLSFAIPATEGKRRIMPWMCLERCGGNATSITNNLREIANHADILTAVSFEAYNLGAGSKLVKNNLTSVHKQISALGLETLAMISSYPYPPDFLSWMRQVFANPQPFIDACLSEALKEGYTGYNVDWEPTTTATSQDAVLYAQFLTKFTDALHKHNKKVTVDIASWSSIWNYTALAASSVDTVFDMSTYTGTFTSFVKELNKATVSFPLSKLGIGLETVNTVNNQPYTDGELQQRFVLIMGKNVQEVDIWDMPIPDNWWPFLDRFSKP